ncbi:MAG: hypothetical protein CMH85_06660 [Novosphingobium sp.]|jgi:DNA-directed RNA polymerase specialized sigma24 family protein|nr:hypothetical protein [Novosphingobium sp.]|tara:strand:- start:729 stop:1139 length:411 start_codon:yes stop_codon:yes gene_type:complete
MPPYRIFRFLRRLPAFLSADFFRRLLPWRRQPRQQRDLRAPGLLIAASRRRREDNQSLYIDDDAAFRLAPDTVTMAVARLSPLARTVLELYQREGLDITTIAERLDLTPQAARAELIDALVVLDESMSTEDGRSTS